MRATLIRADAVPARAGGTAPTAMPISGAVARPVTGRVHDGVSTGDRGDSSAVSLGIIVSVIQAATQIQEMTLTMVPKIVAIFLALLIAFPWIMDKMITFTQNVFLNIPNYIS